MCSLDAYLINTKSIANSVAKYAMSFESLPQVDLKKRRAAVEAHQMLKRNEHLMNHARGHGHGHAGHAGPCGGSGDLK